MIEEILIKLNYYVCKHNIKTITCGGGVICNSLLRQELNKMNVKVLLPDIKYCNDNAAMIGQYYLSK
jgi:tRNA A37 threonylcarbamoyltransferase TsaD